MHSQSNTVKDQKWINKYTGGGLYPHWNPWLFYLQSLQEWVALKLFGEIWQQYRTSKSWIHHTSCQTEMSNFTKNYNLQKGCKNRLRKLCFLCVLKTTIFLHLFNFSANVGALATLPSFWTSLGHKTTQCGAAWNLSHASLIFWLKSSLHHLKWSHQLANLGIIHHGSDWVEAILGFGT